MTPYMCTVCGNAFSSATEAKNCKHLKPKPKPKTKPKATEAKEA